MPDSKGILNPTETKTHDSTTLQCDDFHNALMKNIYHLRQGEGRQVLDALGETGQWHVIQMNGFLKTLALPPITEAIVTMHHAITTKHSNIGNATSTEASIRHGVELSDITYAGSLTVSRNTEDLKQFTLLTLHLLQQQMEAIQRQTTIELAEQSDNIAMIRCSMILDGLNQSLKSLVQCLLCATFPDHCSSDSFSHIQIIENDQCLFDSISVCPRGRNTWAPEGIPSVSHAIYNQND